jgi:hypothetical protein
VLIPRDGEISGFDTKLQDRVGGAIWTDMTNHSHRTVARLAPLATAAALLATACGSSTTTSRPDMAQPEAAVVADEPAPEPEASVVTSPADTAPPVTEPATPEPTSDEPPTEPVETADTTPATPPVTCGDFGPIPPTPDSMPTLMYDTDGDGDVDDAVTAYAGGGEGWMLRVVENGIISEAPMPGIDGWAYISNDYTVDGRDYIEVTDNGVVTIFTHATVTGCVELLDTRDLIDDLGLVPVQPAPPHIPKGPSDLTIVVPPCGLFAPISGAASIASDITVDVADDGTADDPVVTYLDGDWTMRATVDDITSEVMISGVGPGAVRALGVADVGDLTNGNEIIATVGAGAYATQIGVFGIDHNGCLSWSNQFDGTYIMDGAAYIESAPGQFTFMPASDDFSEGLTLDQLPTDLFDCNGLSL